MDNAYKLGFYTSISAAIVTTLTFVIAYLTPPLSGPLCTKSCFIYPFSDIASRFPRDYYWMFPAIIFLVIYIALMAIVHHTSPQNKKIYSHIGLIFAVLGASILITDYFVQLSVIQPSLLNGETDGVAMFSQYNSHGLFIALEELGYLLMSAASLFMAFVFSGSKLTKTIHWTYLSIFILTIAGLAAVSFQYGINREYRFELAAISINWLGFIMSSILLAFFFKKPEPLDIETIK